MVMLKQVNRQNAGEIIYIANNDGKKLFEGFVRQCVHCQFTWTYKPGSGKVATFCKNCDGFVCHKLACNKHCYPAEQFVEDIEAIAEGSRRAIEALVRRAEWLESVYGH